ncbi:hypothetical protein FRC12_013851 [Ceratobasidium sp. 428]|nr:hypothetical protein FRC12_013851 [Ceratobasidium sp. 428]
MVAIQFCWKPCSINYLEGLPGHPSCSGANQLGIGSWMYHWFDTPKTVHPDELTGIFTLLDIQLTYGHDWIMFAMPHTKPEDLADDLDLWECVTVSTYI